MSNQKLTDLTELTSLAAEDNLYIVDVSDTTDGTDGTSKKTLLSRISSYLASLAQTLTNKILTSPVINTPTITSPVINTGVSGTAITDEDDMTSDSATKIPTEQSVKAFVDTHMADTTTHGTTGSIVGTTDTQTLTNKRTTKRVTTITSHATPTINTDNCDVVTITAQGEDITSMTSGLSGTPTNFQTLIIRILDDGTGRAITWGAKFEARGTTLPTTTVASKLLTVGFIYDTVDNIWGCVASQSEA